MQTTTGDGAPDAFVDTSPGAVAEAAAPSDAGREASARACEPPPVASLLPEGSHPDAVVGDQTFSCCVDVLAASFEQPDGAFQAMLTDAAAQDPTVLGCCAAVVVRLDGYYSGASFDSGARDRGELAEAGLSSGYDPAGCCEALRTLSIYPQGPTCSPWGPPMPPAMPALA
jgi:hypothetical protein